MGIIPGQTSAVEAIRRLNETLISTFHFEAPLIDDGTDNPFLLVKIIPYGSSPQHTGHLNLAAQHRTTVFVGLATDYFDPTMPQLGEVVTILGPPACVSIVGLSNEGLILYYTEKPGSAFSFVIAINSPTWTQPIRSPSSSYDLRIPSCRGPSYLRWRGLGDASLYLNTH